MIHQHTHSLAKEHDQVPTYTSFLLLRALNSSDLASDKSPAYFLAILKSALTQGVHLIEYLLVFLQPLQHLLRAHPLLAAGDGAEHRDLGIGELMLDTRDLKVSQHLTKQEAWYWCLHWWFLMLGALSCSLQMAHIPAVVVHESAFSQINDVNGLKSDLGCFAVRAVDLNSVLGNLQSSLIVDLIGEAVFSDILESSESSVVFMM